MNKKYIALMLIILMLIMIECSGTKISGKKQGTNPQNLNSTTYNECREKADNYLISMFGETLFHESIALKKIYNTSFSGWGAECNVYHQNTTSEHLHTKDPTKYVVEYVLDLSPYFEEITPHRQYRHPQRQETIRIRVVLDIEQQIYCTENVVDCNKYPEYCPPYIIDNVQDAIEIFEEKCNMKNYVVRLVPYKDKSSIESFNESKFVWEFSDLWCGELHCSITWQAYMDPNTRQIITETHRATELHCE